MAGIKTEKKIVKNGGHAKVASGNPLQKHYLEVLCAKETEIRRTEPGIDTSIKTQDLESAARYAQLH